MFLGLASLAVLACSHSAGGIPDPTDGGAEVDSDGSDVADDASVVFPDGGCPTTYAGCTTFEDRTSPSAERSITFSKPTYTPKCIQVVAGQTVSFVGDFGAHPLSQACGPTQLVEYHAAPNTPPGTTSTTRFVMNTPGTYGYWCLEHGTQQGTGMAGVIQVVPAPTNAPSLPNK